MTRRALIVNDEPDIRDVARASLELIGGWHVSTAASCDEALPTAISERPDVILLDVMMPGADGPEVLSRLQGEAVLQATPVIFLTAKTQAAEVRALLDLGARGVISKPFDPLELPAEISRLLEWE